MAELINCAKKCSGQPDCASSGNGTTVHLATEAFRAEAGIFMAHVPYKSTVLVEAIPSGMPHVKSGHLQALQSPATSARP